MKIIKDFDLYSPEWLDITFKNRNKHYGAYDLRNDSSNRHIKAIAIVFVVGLLAIFLPKVVETIDWRTGEVTEETSEAKTTQINQMDEQEKPKDDIQVDLPPPPPEIKKAVQVTEIVIKKDNEVPDNNTLITNNELDKLDDVFDKENREGEKGPSKSSGLDTVAQLSREEPPERFPAIKAEFPGGAKALMGYLNTKMDYPQDALDAGVEGMVMIEFVVKTDGTIDNVTVKKTGGHRSLDNEAVRVVKSMPKWKPGTNEAGVAVSSYFQLPVHFQLQKQKKN